MEPPTEAAHQKHQVAAISNSSEEYDKNICFGRRDERTELKQYILLFKASV